MRTLIVAVALALGLTGAARAEVTDRSPAGFEISQTAVISAPRSQVWNALLTPALWWSPKHSWSGDPKNLAINIGQGCFCEALEGGGFVRHLEIVYIDGGSTLRLAGALGPLVFTGATGHLAVVLKDLGGKTQLTLTYDVGGYAKGGLAETWATPVDGVLGEQLVRLQRYVETGKAD